MANNTWNFPCWQCKDRGPAFSRNTGGELWEVGPSAQGAPGTSQPFTDTMTGIFSFLVRSGWTSQDGGQQGIMSIGANGVDTPLQIEFITSSTNPAIRLRVTNGIDATVRHQVLLGDEDGTNWLQDDKWYQIAYAVNASGIEYAVNGSASPKVTVQADSAGSIAFDNSDERVWLHGPPAGWPATNPQFITSHWPSVVVGAAAYSTILLDLTSQAVRDRIFDSNGDFKNPGENGSLWFADGYGSTIPEYYFTDGSPRYQKGSDTQVWAAVDGGSDNPESAPGGLRKQYAA